MLSADWHSCSHDWKRRPVGRNQDGRQIEECTSCGHRIIVLSAEFELVGEKPMLKRRRPLMLVVLPAL